MINAGLVAGPIDETRWPSLRAHTRRISERPSPKDDLLKSTALETDRPRAAGDLIPVHPCTDEHRLSASAPFGRLEVRLVAGKRILRLAMHGKCRTQKREDGPMATSTKRKMRTADRTRKRERLELRLAPAAKKLIQRAMSVSGLAAGDLAYEGARRVLDEHERMVLTGVDRDVFLKAVLDPPQPTKRLVAALKRHRELFG